MQFGMHTDEPRGSESFSDVRVTQPLEKFPTNYSVRRLTAVLTGDRYSYSQEKLRNIAYYALPSMTYASRHEM